MATDTPDPSAGAAIPPLSTTPAATATNASVPPPTMTMDPVATAPTQATPAPSTEPAAEPPPVPVSCAGPNRGLNDIDLLGASTTDGFTRVYGSTGTGVSGVPVAGGYDLNGDGFKDTAFAAFRASPLGRDEAGQIYVVLGNGGLDESLDTAAPNPRILTIAGTSVGETTGSEVWMGDVTGDGLGDLLIARQNLDGPGGRASAGGVTILAGSANLTNVIADLATQGAVLDLASPPASVSLTTLVGAVAGDRLGVWMRVGDVTGDGITDLVTGADQADIPETSSGAGYLIRGGAHLATGGTYDVGALDASMIPNVARFDAGAGSANFHLGGTIAIGDLDGNGRGEIIAAATLNRSGQAVGGQGQGGAPDGRLYILWDDNFNETSWPSSTATALDFSVDTAPGTLSTLRGGATETFSTDFFGEEILGGSDYDNDGNPDLFVGDLTATRADLPDAGSVGVGVVFWGAAALRGLDFDLANLPAGQEISVFLGPGAGAISSDTALEGDFDGDGIVDLSFSSPTFAPLGRTTAGTVHVIWGQTTRWPALVDLRPDFQPPSDQVVITDILGANGSNASNAGDTLAYSAAAGDIDGDGRADIITNEMRGDGQAAGAIDVGNLLVLGGEMIACFGQ